MAQQDLNLEEFLIFLSQPGNDIQAMEAEFSTFKDGLLQSYTEDARACVEKYLGECGNIVLIRLSTRFDFESLGN